MKTNILSTFFVSSLLNVTALAGGPPTIYNHCTDQIKIKAPENGSGVYFSADCRIAYVLPPTVGSISISDFTKTTNTEMCDGYLMLLKSMRARATRVGQAIQRLTNMIESEGPSSSNGAYDPLFPTPPKENTSDDAVMAEMEKRERELRANLTEIMSFNESYSRVEGPYARIAFRADHIQMVEAYKQANKNLVAKGLTFEAMPLSRAAIKLTSNLSGGQAPAVFSSTSNLSALAPEDFLGLGGQNEGREGKNQAGLIFGPNATAQVSLTLIGACPFYNSSTKKMAERASPRFIEGYLISNGQYLYNVQANRNIEFKYNRAELLRRIQKQSTKGGFFSSKTVNELTVGRESKSWFDFKSHSDDPRINWDAAILESIRSQLVAQTFNELGVVPVGQGEAPGLVTPGRTGASVAAETLKLCPHIYCQAGGYILDILNSTIGGSSAVSQFMATNDVWKSGRISESQMLPYAGQLQFEAK